jgi:NitT/TauT family transport system ATP-binding protein
MSPSAAYKDRIVLTCKGINHRFGDKRILSDVNLEIGRGEIVAFVGESGCGKSVLLRAIVGTHPPTEGSIIMRSSRGEFIAVDGPGPDRGIVYQRYSLFPHLTAQENVALGLAFDRTTLPERVFQPGKFKRLERAHLQEAAQILIDFGLQDSLERYPTEMSGGMCQRVAIAQALITKPRLLLMDEPFGALDEATREELQRMLLRLYEGNLKAVKAGEPAPVTIVIVTHELNEALYVGDRVVGLSKYWDYKSHGHKEFPGATIVYDDAAPVCTSDGKRDFAPFDAQREEISRIVYDKDPTRLSETNLRFWKRVATGDVEGVMAL